MSVFWDFTDLPRDMYIETGLGLGRSLRAAHAAGFATCHSIDVDGEIAIKMTDEFQNVPIIFIHCGPSPEILPSIIDPSREIVFWLDAHYSGGNFHYDENHVELPQCPLADELRIISQVKWSIPPIVRIDDVFMFEDEFWQQDPPDPKWAGEVSGFRREEWPRLAELQEIMTGWTFTKLNRDQMEFRLGG
jgi:hypothetical protein